MVIVPQFEREQPPMALTSSLSFVGRSHTLRCDAKQAERRFLEFEEYISAIPHFELGSCLPSPFMKGSQPRYIESLDPDGIPVISTVAIQDLSVQVALCRFITGEDYDAINDQRKPRPGDVLLTMDGGTSIGKPVLFDLEDDFATDSHVAILRPVGLDPKLLVYLLASQLGQLQFQQAESGASGQTAVTEADVRRFRFPILDESLCSRITSDLEIRLQKATQMELQARKMRRRAWLDFYKAMVTCGEVK